MPCSVESALVSANADRPRSSIWIYPWDLLDEGAEPALRQARDVAGVDAVNLAVTYHAGLFLLPHNPRRRLYVAEDGVLYFRADRRLFERSPAPTFSSLTDTIDPLAEALRAARRLDVRVRAWTVCCHNSRIAQAHPDLAVLNALGDRLPFALCPLQPAVQEYLGGLIDALRAYPDLEAIELEALYWLAANHDWHHAKFGLPLDDMTWALLGVCCCEACARSAGVDREQLERPLKERLLAAMAGEPLGPASRATVAAIGAEVGALLAAREESLARLLARLTSRAHVPIRALVGSGLVEGAWKAGIDLEAWSHAAPALTVNAYGGSADAVRSTLQGFRRAAPATRYLAVGINATHPITTSEEHLRTQTLAAAQSEPDELSFYHYGLLPLARLGWIRHAVQAARSALNEAVLDD
jgi:hypothetical protein